MRNRRPIIIDGVQYRSIAEACRDRNVNRLGLHPNIVRERLRQGYTIYDAFNKPYFDMPRKVRNKRFTYRQTECISGDLIAMMCANPYINIYGLTKSTIMSRIKRGWSIERAFKTPLR
ncbi:MAG: hypothetical protein QXD03_05150 [Candidatus Anstonellales archaeon]